MSEMDVLSADILFRLGKAKCNVLVACTPSGCTIISNNPNVSHDDFNVWLTGVTKCQIENSLET